MTGGRQNITSTLDVLGTTSEALEERSDFVLGYHIYPYNDTLRTLPQINVVDNIIDIVWVSKLDKWVYQQRLRYNRNAKFNFNIVKEKITFTFFMLIFWR